MTSKRPRKRISGPAKTLLVLIVVTILLISVDRFRTAREISLATGPSSQGQRSFFIEAADRPGIELFYKGLTSAQKVAMAKQLGFYDDPKIIGLTGKLLDTFDKTAYAALTESLTKQAKSNPSEAVKLITIGATRPKFAIRTALLAARPLTLKPLATAMIDPATRGDAKRLLLEAGPEAEPYIRPLVQNGDADVRTEAASLLGQYKKTESLGALGKAFRASKPPERTKHLAAIVAIGVPQNRTFFEGVFSDHKYTEEERILAAHALAKIGTPLSIAPLAKALLSSKGEDRSKLIEALSAAGDKVWGLTTLTPNDRFQLACRLRTQRADAFLSSAIDSGKFDIIGSLDSLSGREDLTPALQKFVLRINPKKDSHKVMQVLSTLATTESGLKALEKLRQNPKIGGLAMRTLRLAQSPE